MILKEVHRIIIVSMSILSIVSLMNCVDKSPPITDIPEETLVLILKDLMLADAGVQVKLQDEVEKKQTLEKAKANSDTLKQPTKQVAPIENVNDIRYTTELPFDRDSASAKLYRVILNRYQVTPAQFEVAYRAYMEKPIFADTLSARVLRKLDEDENQQRKRDGK